MASFAKVQTQICVDFIVFVQISAVKDRLLVQCDLQLDESIRGTHIYIGYIHITCSRSQCH